VLQQPWSWQPLPYWCRVGRGGRFTRTLLRAGLDRKGLSIYSLRHTFAADLISAGRSMQEVAAAQAQHRQAASSAFGSGEEGRCSPPQQGRRPPPMTP
jgi:hypothetical protein